MKHYLKLIQSAPDHFTQSHSCVLYMRNATVAFEMQIKLAAFIFKALEQAFMAQLPYSTGNPMDTYRAHKTCGSWPTYTDIQHNTKRERERQQEEERASKEGTQTCTYAKIKSDHSQRSLAEVWPKRKIYNPLFLFHALHIYSLTNV